MLAVLAAVLAWSQRAFDGTRVYEKHWLSLIRVVRPTTLYPRTTFLTFFSFFAQVVSLVGYLPDNTIVVEYT
jgi:hypothetical protein